MHQEMFSKIKHILLKNVQNNLENKGWLCFIQPLGTEVLQILEFFTFWKTCIDFTGEHQILQAQSLLGSFWDSIEKDNGLKFFKNEV